MTLAENTVHQIDALDLLRALPDASVDCVLTDPPYGTTACAWDTPIDLPAWWAAVRRVVKRNAAIVMTASQPFTSALVMSNANEYRHDWVWHKKYHSNPFVAETQPLRVIESVLVFGLHTPNYYPQSEARPDIYRRPNPRVTTNGETLNGKRHISVSQLGSTMCPDNFLYFPLPHPTDREGGHPTQKPVALFEYLIRTYTRPGDLVVDPFGGSGTTAVAARNLGRRYITGDTDAGYCAIMRRRLSEPYTPQMFAEEADAVDDAPRQVEMFAQGADNAK